jgi:hypothetical protein
MGKGKRGQAILTYYDKYIMVEKCHAVGYIGGCGSFPGQLHKIGINIDSPGAKFLGSPDNDTPITAPQIIQDGIGIHPDQFQSAVDGGSRCWYMGGPG